MIRCILFAIVRFIEVKVGALCPIKQPVMRFIKLLGSDFRCFVSPNKTNYSRIGILNS